MVRTWNVHCREHGFDPWSGELGNQDPPCLSTRPKKKKKNVYHPTQVKVSTCTPWVVPEEVHRRMGAKMWIMVSHPRVVEFLGNSYFLPFVGRNGERAGRRLSRFPHPHLPIHPSILLQPHSCWVLILFDSPVFHLLILSPWNTLSHQLPQHPGPHPCLSGLHFSHQLCEIIFLSPSFPPFLSGFCPGTFPFLDL